MAKLIACALLALLLSAVPGTALARQEHQHGGSEKLGTVKFATSCAPAAAPAFNRAMALLHSFEFLPAIEGFTAVTTTDSGCAIAYWGMALSRWGNPFAAGLKPPAQLEAGRAAIEKANAIGARTERERDYIAAAGRLYADFEKVDQSTRLRSYCEAMAGVAAKYPDDPEASAFYAVALIAANDPTDRTYANLLKAGAILDRLAPTQPDHPGFVHYIIHAYDVPPLAPKAVEAARLYSKIAPSAPHALHMPSHTFTRLGYWQDSIDTNIASASAAKREKAPAEELHAMDYQAYAYLQLAQDRAALGLVDALPEIKARFDPDKVSSAAPGSAGVFALAAIPARYALERQAWGEAAALKVSPSKFAQADAMTWFARGLGAARSGNPAAAREAIDALQKLEAALAKAGESYWTEQVAIQRLGVTAWTALADGRTEEALTVMREAAGREDRTEKSAVTPGPLAPARELLGYMLIAVKRPTDALAAFDITLAKEPNRYRALAGAVEAAKQTGDANAVKKYLEPLVALTDKADVPGRPEIAALKTGPSRQ